MRSSSPVLSAIGITSGPHILLSSAAPDHSRALYLCAGSTQGIGMGMLRGLAEAGADVMMHGLVTADEAKSKTAEIANEFGVQCRHSAADVTKPAEIRYCSLDSNQQCRRRCVRNVSAHAVMAASHVCKCYFWTSSAVTSGTAESPEAPQRLRIVALAMHTDCASFGCSLVHEWASNVSWMCAGI